MQPQLRGDVVGDVWRRRRCQREEGHARHAIAQGAEIAVLGAKVLPPKIDEVRLVDGDGEQLLLIVEPLEQPLEAI